MSDQTHHESEAWIVAKKEMRALRDENADLRKQVQDQALDHLSAEGQWFETEDALRKRVEELEGLLNRAIPEIHDDESTSAMVLREDILAALADRPKENPDDE